MGGKHQNLPQLLSAGHSLGGALATLAAFDIRRHLLDNMQSDAEVVCYTFAAPRTGNHAFAREYNAMVPDSWSVINDQVRRLNPFHSWVHSVDMVDMCPGVF